MCGAGDAFVISPHDFHVAGDRGWYGAFVVPGPLSLAVCAYVMRLVGSREGVHKAAGAIRLKECTPTLFVSVGRIERIPCALAKVGDLRPRRCVGCRCFCGVCLGVVLCTWPFVRGDWRFRPVVMPGEAGFYGLGRNWSKAPIPRACAATLTRMMRHISFAIRRHYRLHLASQKRPSLHLTDKDMALLPTFI